VLHEPFDGGTADAATSRGTTLAFERGVRGKAAKFDATQHVETRLRDFNPDAAWTVGLWLLPEGPLGGPLSLIEPARRRRGIELIWAKGLLKVHLVNRWAVSAIEASTTQPVAAKQWHHVVVRYDGSRKAKGLGVFVDGSPAKLDVRLDTLDGTVANAEPLRIG